MKNTVEQLKTCVGAMSEMIRMFYDSLIQQGFTTPEKWIKVKIPRQLSEEKRQELKNRALKNFHSEDGGDNCEQE